MGHSVVAPATEVEIQSGAVVSKVVYRDDDLNVTVFGFDAGEGLTEHQARRSAIVQVLSGELPFTVDDAVHELGPGSWLHMAPGTPHALEAVEPTVMMLTLLKPDPGSARLPATLDTTSAPGRSRGRCDERRQGSRAHLVPDGVGRLALVKTSLRD
jgi:quercetin dioxygenase-like cupin family protein